MRTIVRNDYDPQPGDYHERIIIDETRDRRWLFDCDGVFMPFNEIEVVNERGNATTKAVSQKLFTDTVEDLEGDIDDLQGDLADEISAREAADDHLQDEIDDLKNAPDVVDIVPTYAALQAYDTSKLGDNDIIRVLADETHDGQSTYYRWNKTSSTWTYIGAVGPYYTKDQTDALLADKESVLMCYTLDLPTPAAGQPATMTLYKDSSSTIPLSGQEFDSALNDRKTTIKIYEVGGDYMYQVSRTVSDDAAYIDTPDGTYEIYPDIYGTSNEYTVYYYNAVYTAGANVQISPQRVISATDTTYSDFVGTDGTAAGIRGLVPAPATTDANKFLNSDGTWKEANGVEFIDASGVDFQELDPTLGPAYCSSEIDTMSKTASEIISIIKSGKKAVLRLTIDEEETPSSMPFAFDGAKYYIDLSYEADIDGGGGIISGSLVVLGANGNLGYVPLNLLFLMDTEEDTGYLFLMDMFAVDFAVLNSRINYTNSVPTTSTPASTVGSLLVGSGPSTKGKVYVCTDIIQGTDPDPDTYIWKEVGASNLEIVEFTNLTWDNPISDGTSISTTACTSSKTYAEILAAMAEGKEVVIHFVMPDNLFGQGGDRMSPMSGDYYVKINSKNTDDGILLGTASAWAGFWHQSLTVLMSSTNESVVMVTDSLMFLAVDTEKMIKTRQGAPTTSTVGGKGQILEDITNGKLYICTAVTPGVDPNPTTYTWEEIAPGTISTINSQDWSALWQ